MFVIKCKLILYHNRQLSAKKNIKEYISYWYSINRILCHIKVLFVGKILFLCRHTHLRFLSQTLSTFLLLSPNSRPFSNKQHRRRRRRRRRHQRQHRRRLRCSSDLLTAAKVAATFTRTFRGRFSRFFWSRNNLGVWKRASEVSPAAKGLHKKAFRWGRNEGKGRRCRNFRGAFETEKDREVKVCCGA